MQLCLLYWSELCKSVDAAVSADRKGFSRVFSFSFACLQISLLLIRLLFLLERFRLRLIAKHFPRCFGRFGWLGRETE